MVFLEIVLSRYHTSKVSIHLSKQWSLDKILLKWVSILSLHTLKKNFVFWYTSKNRWSAKNGFIRIINPAINPFFGQIPLMVFLPLQIDTPQGIFFINIPFLRTWNRCTLKIRLNISHDKPHFYGYIRFKYAKRVYYWRKCPGVYQFATVEISLRVFDRKKGL